MQKGKVKPTNTQDFIEPTENQNAVDQTAEQNLGQTVLPKQKATTTSANQQDTQSTSYAWDTDASYTPGKKTEYSPNSQGYNNTGSGINAALGTQYSWEKQGTEKATNQYATDVLSIKQNAQENASAINQNISQYQEQADMMQYQNNQQAEKVGWTGGYVLDQNRQMDYLKASLNAQMYGAIKLQEYGYDTSLAAARLSYDLNQKAYAQEYYNQAVTNALNEAQITGTYFSAEIKDMMNQYSVAQQVLDSNPSEEDMNKATQIITQIDNWFATNNISKEGVLTIQAWQAQQSNEYNWSQQLWTEYNALLEAAKTNVNNNETFLMYGDNDQVVYENGEVKTINLSQLSNEELKNYAANSTSGKEQVQSYFTSLSEQIKNENKSFNSDGKLEKIDRETINNQLKELELKYKSIFGENTELNVEGYTKDSEGNFVETTSEGNKNQVSNQLENLRISKINNSIIAGDSDNVVFEIEGQKYNIPIVTKKWINMATDKQITNTNGWKIAKEGINYLDSLNEDNLTGDIALYNDHYFIYSNQVGGWCMINTDTTDTSSFNTTELINKIKKIL